MPLDFCRSFLFPYEARVRDHFEQVVTLTLYMVKKFIKRDGGVYSSLKIGESSWRFVEYFRELLYIFRM